MIGHSEWGDSETQGFSKGISLIRLLRYRTRRDLILGF